MTTLRDLAQKAYREQATVNAEANRQKWQERRLLANAALQIRYELAPANWDISQTHINSLETVVDGIALQAHFEGQDIEIYAYLSSPDDGPGWRYFDNLATLGQHLAEHDDWMAREEALKRDYSVPAISVQEEIDRR